jgi:hypothetical protein
VADRRLLAVRPVRSGRLHPRRRQPGWCACGQRMPGTHPAHAARVNVPSCVLTTGSLKPPRAATRRWSRNCSRKKAPAHDIGGHCREMPGMPRSVAISGRECGPHLRPQALLASVGEKGNGTFPQVSVAEDRRFELLRGCPQHAFQQCWPAFTGVRHRPRTAQTRSGRTLVNGPGRG